MAHGAPTDDQFDVFLSHSSADKAFVEALALRLEDEASIKPFLDKWHLVPGEPWQEALEHALDTSASCAVFLGPSGLGSWENEEMRAALDARHRSKTLRVIPVLLPGADPKDPATLPRFLQRLTWVDFRSGLDDGEAFRHLVAGIQGQAPGRGTITEVEKASGKAGILRFVCTRCRRMLPWLALVAPTLLWFVVAMFFAGIYLPTRIEMDLVANRVVFTVGDLETNWLLLLKTLPFDAITVEQFSTISFNPLSVEVADPAQYDLLTDRYPESAWQPVSTTPPVVIYVADELLHPAVAVQGAKPELHQLGTLDALTVQAASEVTLEVSEIQGDLSVKVENQQSRIVMSLNEPFQLIAHHVHINGLAATPFDANSFNLKVGLGNDPNLEVASLPLAFSLLIQAVALDGGDVFSEAAIPVTSLDFTRQEATGARVTALVGEGELRYPDHPNIETVTLEPRTMIGLDRLEKFRIETIRLDSERKALRLRAAGVAGHLRSGSSEYPVDHRLTLFDELKHSRVVLLMIVFLLWFLPTTLGAYRLYKSE